MIEDEIKAGGCVVLALASLFAVLVLLISQASWVSESAKIEQLRRDSKIVNAKMAEDVAGQVAEANQRIAQMQRWRKTPVGFLFPSGWERVELIPMPEMLEFKP